VGSLASEFPFNVNVLSTDLEQSLSVLDRQQREELEGMRANYARIIELCRPNSKPPMDSMLFMSPKERSAWHGNQDSEGINHQFLMYCPNYEWINSLDEGLYYLAHTYERSMTKTTLCFPTHVTITLFFVCCVDQIQNGWNL
jgi:hypothetical protein